MSLKTEGFAVGESATDEQTILSLPEDLFPRTVFSLNFSF